MNKPLSYAELANLAAQTEDQTETQAHADFEFTPPPAGKTVGRFIGYIELGKQPQRPYQGKEKPPADSVRIVFELLHPNKNIHEYEEDGTKKVRADIISFTLAKKLSEKARFKKLFNKMTYGRPIKHMSQMLGEAFIIDVFHNEVEKDGKKNVYVNIDKDGEWFVGAPFIMDPLTEVRTDVAVREPISPLRLFLWDHPTKETWESLFIDGTRTVKDKDGTERQESKNWLQERIMSAVNFKGSALEIMQAGIDDLPTTGLTEQAEKSPEPAKETVSKPAGASAASSANDALAALGLA